MVPGSEHPSDTDRHDERASNGGREPAPGFDEAALFTVVRDAVKDALLDVIGMVLLVGVAFVLVIAGAQAALQSEALTGLVAGIGVTAVGLYLAAATLEIIPPLREWV